MIETLSYFAAATPVR